MEALTLEVVERVSLHVDYIREAINLLRTCKQFYEISKRDSFWRTLYKLFFLADQDFIENLKLAPCLEEKKWAIGLFLKSFTSEVRTWQSTFISRYRYAELLAKVPDYILESDQLSDYNSEHSEDSDSETVESTEKCSDQNLDKNSDQNFNKNSDQNSNKNSDQDAALEKFECVLPARRGAYNAYHKEVEEGTNVKAFLIKNIGLHFYFPGDEEIRKNKMTDERELRPKYDPEDAPSFSLFDDWDFSDAIEEPDEERKTEEKRDPTPVVLTPEQLIARGQRARRTEELEKQKKELEIEFYQKTKTFRSYMIEFCAKVYYAILTLTHQELQANTNKYTAKIDRVFVVDPYHFSIQAHPHAHVGEELKTNNKWNGELDENLNGWLGLAAKLFCFQSGKPIMPPVMLLLMDNVEWTPKHRKWGFYSNFAGEVFMWGKLLDIVEKEINLNNTDIMDPLPITKISQLRQ